MRRPRLDFRVRLHSIAGVLVLASIIFSPRSSSALYTSPPPQPSPVPSSKAEHFKGRVIVKLAESVGVAIDRLAPQGPMAGISGGGLQKLNQRFGLKAIRPMRRSDASLDSLAARRQAEAARRSPRAAKAPSFASAYIFEFDLPPDANETEIARAYAADPSVEWAQPDWIRRAELIPNDPYLSSSNAWRQGFSDLWGLDRIDAPEAWDKSRGAGVVIAISDTGIDPLHPDIAANLWVNPGEIASNGIDDDNNGFIDDLHGWNFVADSPDINDDHGHGTHVAGTAAAVGGNGEGITGVAFEARVMAVKGLGSTGSGTDSDLAAGILYAVENGARVINASWGAITESSPVLSDAIDTAHAADVVFVAAAGNNGVEVDYTPITRIDPPRRSYPAAYRKVITVAATNHDDDRAFFSNYGVKIDVAAPGGGDPPPPANNSIRSILSLKAADAGNDMTGGGALIIDGNYLRQAGTSMAAPHVSGAAALILSQHPEYDAEQVRQALRRGADDVGATGFDLFYGHGRLNADRALAVIAPLAAHIETPINHLSIKDAAIEVTGSAYGPGFASYTLEYALGSNPSNWIVAVGPITTEVLTGVLGSVSTAAVPDGELYLRLRATNTSGEVFEDHVLEFLDRVDVTAPEYNSRYRGGAVDIIGTVAQPDMLYFVVEWQRPGIDDVNVWFSNGVTLTGGGTQPIVDGVLGTLDFNALADPIRINLQLRVESASGTTRVPINNLIRDSSVRQGWPRNFIDPKIERFGVAGPGTPTLADLDDDGVTEILLGFRRANVSGVYVIEPDGSDRPGWPQNVAVTSGPCAGDLDGDGRLEVIAVGKHEVFGFRDDGTALPGWPVAALDVQFSQCAIADLDGDGRGEVIFRSGTWATTGPRVNAVRIDGTSLPGFPVDLDTDRITEIGHQLAVGDVDGDGSTDIAVIRNEHSRGVVGYNDGAVVYGESRWNIRLLLLDSHGQIKPGWPKKIGREVITLPWNKQVFTVPLIADIDADGVADVLVTGNRLGQIRAFHGDGSKVRTRLRLDVPSVRRVKSDDRHDPLIAADITGSGLPEIFLATDAGQDTNYGYPHDAVDFLGILAYDGERWTPAAGWPKQFIFQGSIPKTHGPGSMSVGDIDGDGDQDLVLGLQHCIGWRIGPYNCDGLIAYAGDGTVLPGFPKLTHAPATPLSQPAIGDLDGDGLQEIVWMGESGELLVWNIPGVASVAHHEWPMVAHDPAHTRALPVSP